MIGTKKKPTKPRPRPSAEFNPLDWQIAPWRDRRSEVVLLDGPAGTGKSHIAGHKADGFMRKYPNATGLVIRKTRESMTNSTILFLEQVVIGNDPYVKLNRQSKRFEYANGSILTYGGMKDDSQRESIRSIGQAGGVDFIWIEEATQLTLADYEELLPRLRGQATYHYYRKQALAQGMSEREANQFAHDRAWTQIILTTNPDSNTHWIYRLLIAGGGATRYLAKTADNTYNPKNYAGILDRLTGVRAKRLREGLWVNAEGAVYEDWRVEVHVVDSFPIPNEWRRFRSIDFGYKNPFVCQWWAIDHDNRLYLYREIYFSERTVTDHADTIQMIESGIDAETWRGMSETEKYQAWKSPKSEYHKIMYTVADHDAGERAILSQKGITSKPAKKDITLGIERVQERLRVDGSGKPSLMVLCDALYELDPALYADELPACTMDEFPAYVYPIAKDGKPNKELPIDLHNHGLDATRYAVMSVDSSTAVKQTTRRRAKMRTKDHEWNKYA